MDKSPINGNRALAVMLSRYGAVLETADLSSISKAMLEQIYALNENVITASDPRTALLTSIADAVQEHDDRELAMNGTEDIYGGVFKPACGNLIDLLALEQNILTLDLLQCTALIERLEEISIFIDEYPDYGCAVDQVYERMTRGIF